MKIDKASSAKFLDNHPPETTQSLIRADMKAGLWLPLRIAIPSLYPGDVLIVGGFGWDECKIGMVHAIDQENNVYVLFRNPDDSSLVDLSRFREHFELEIKWLKHVSEETKCQ